MSEREVELTSEERARLNEGERAVMRAKAVQQGMDSVILYAERLIAARLADAEARAEAAEAKVARVEALWDYALAAFGQGWTINGSQTQRYHGNLNLRRARLDVGRLISEVRDVAFSAAPRRYSGDCERCW